MEHSRADHCEFLLVEWALLLDRKKTKAVEFCFTSLHFTGSAESCTAGAVMNQRGCEAADKVLAPGEPFRLGTDVVEGEAIR